MAATPARLPAPASCTGASPGRWPESASPPPGGLSTGYEAKFCLACDPAPCAAACPTGAFSQRRGGGVVVRKSLCIRCGKCAQACPVDAVTLDATGEPFVCIHCGRCVRYCPHDCLEMAESPADSPGRPQAKEVVL